MSSIELKGVSKFYKSQETVSTGMRNISVSFDFGEFVAITGSSGSGKSTLLNVLSGLDGYEEGELYLFGEETSHYTIDDWERYRSAYVGFVFQNYNIIDSFTVLQNVMLALEIQGYPIKQRKKRSLELIERVGLLSHKHHKAAKLSGGQKQRVVIARALAKDCPIIVADEPTGNLDSATAKEVMALLHELSQDKLVIVVTHDYSQVAPYATRKIQMSDGGIIENQILKPYQPIDNPVAIQPKKMDFVTLLSFAWKNIFSQPKRLFFILLLQILVVGVLTVLYTGQAKTIRETGLSNSSLFNHVPSTRLLVQRRDGQSIGADDIAYLESFRDVQYVYQNGENFRNNQRLYIHNSRSWDRSLNYIDTARILKPHQVRGAMPVTYNEIVVSQDFDYSIGDSVYISSEQYLSIGQLTSSIEFLPLQTEEPNIYTELFKVVGITSMGSRTVYLSEVYLQNTVVDPLIDASTKDSIEYVLRDGYNYNVIIDGEMRQSVSESMTYWYDPSDFNRTLYLSDAQVEDSITETITIHFDMYYYNIGVNVSLSKTYTLKSVMHHSDGIIAILDQDLLDVLVIDFLALAEPYYMLYPIEAASVSVSGYSSGNRLLKQIDSTIYRVYYPANVKDALRPIYQFLYTILAIFIIGLMGSFLYTILHVVTKNIMSSRQKDFAIYRSIGANKSSLGQLVILEQVILSLSSLAIVIVLLRIIGYFNMYIGSIVDYLLWSDFLFLLIIFTLFGVLSGIRFNRRIFNQSVIETLSLAKEDLS